MIFPKIIVLNPSKSIMFDLEVWKISMKHFSRYKRLIGVSVFWILYNQICVVALAQVSLNTLQLASPIRVKTVKPVLKPEIKLSIEQPADVASYYRAELFSEVAGKVVFLEKDLGDAVKSGEKIIEIKPSPGQLASQNSGEMIAPFDGVISSRTVDPGTFVPSAAIVPGARPLITIERNDIVTISMKVPDQYASLVNLNTIAEIRMDPLPGQVVKAKLSRIAPSLSVGDRTLTVQVDLFNRSSGDYEKLKSQFEKNGGSDLKSRRLPEFPHGLTSRDNAGLIPGMYGKMKLILNLPVEWLYIPVNAIHRLGGVEYIYRVDNGLAHKTSIKTIFDNGTYARVILSGNSPVDAQLNQNDEIITSSHSELVESQPVESILIEPQHK